MECVFCKISSQEIKSPFLAENKSAFAIADLHPAAQFHALIIPKQHFENITDLIQSSNGNKVLEDMMSLLPMLVERYNLSSGFRLINNCGEDGGQTVPHVHFHVLGGEKLKRTII